MTRIHSDFARRMTRLWAAAISALAVTVSWASIASAQCAADTDCKGTRVCKAGRCMAASTCTRDTDCPGDAICQAQQCQLPGAPPPTAAPLPPAAGRPGYAAPATAYRTESRGNKGLLIAGPVVLGATYITTISVTSAISSSGKAIGYSTIPLFGPWVMIASEDVNTDDYMGALVASGVIQFGGLAMLILGATLRTEVKVPAMALAGGSERSSLSLQPVASPAQTGFVATMTW